MRPRRVMTAEHANEIFSVAARSNAIAVVTTQDADDWKTYKSRFLEIDPHRKFFVLDHEPLNGQVPPEVVPGQFVGVSFRHKSRKILFATVVEARGRFLIDGHTGVTAVRYRWPETLTELQRRAYYRTPIPEGTNLLASLWSGGLTARATAQESTLEIRTGRLIDISCGGTQIRLNDVAPPAWGENETVGAELQLGDQRPPILINGQYRGTREDPGAGVCIAIQFIGLELSVDGQLVLQRLAKSVQRFHVQTTPGRPRNGSVRFRA